MNISELYGGEGGEGSICTDNDNMDIKRVYGCLQGVRAWWQWGRTLWYTERTG